MTTHLDDAEPRYQKWFATYAALCNKVLTVQLDRLQPEPDRISQAILESYTVIFRDVHYLEVLDEMQTDDEFFAGRELGVLARHEDSELLKRRRDREISKTPRILFHYSLMTTDEVFCVLTSFEPELVRNDG